MNQLFSYIHDKHLLYLNRIRKNLINSPLNMAIYIIFRSLDDCCLYIYKSLPTLTRYFPFSLIGQEKLYHYNNRHIREMIHKLEDAFIAKKAPVLFLSGVWDKHFYVLSGSFTTDQHLPLEEIDKMTKQLLKLTEPDVFVRLEGDNEIYLLFAREIVENQKK